MSNAQKLGYRVRGSSVTGPDGYTFELAKRPANRNEVFSAINFAVHDPDKTSQWYVDFLGMERQVDTHGGEVSVFFSTEKSRGGVVFNFRAGAPVVPTPYDGRNAFSLPAADVRRIYGRLAEISPERIVHKLQEIFCLLTCLLNLTLR